ncbi:MAG: type II toxin-antitoxin system HipA family toxin YjjJ [Mariprofundaceae bacterium]|nr:type II toxin-antitoxin system HipA family toxin YjjJ [Mariprofundaceae bacterium]
MSVSIQEYLRRAPATSKEIQLATSQNQAAVSRQLRAMADSVIKIPNGRSPLYALACNAFGGGDRFSIFMVDAQGTPSPVAYLRPLAHGGFFIEAFTGIPSVLMGDSKNGLFDDLPYFLEDLRPQGFLGRKIAANLAGQDTHLPHDPKRWSKDQLGRYLVANGDDFDFSGNLVFSLQGCLRIRRCIEKHGEDDYSQLAEQVLGDDSYGSSAGGEQPKFTTFCRERQRHVIVKFSPKGESDVARRWRDMLITEHYATEALHVCHTPAAETKLIEKGGRLFLESIRFDRSGEYGRLAMLSLQVVDAEFVGDGQSWPSIAEAMLKMELMGSLDDFFIRLLWCFGRMIHNTDMHTGNLSLSIEGDCFKLLPIYDMCSMGFAPKSGEVLAYDFVAPKLDDLSLEEHECLVLLKATQFFWESISLEALASDELRAFALSQLQGVENEK